ncbi:hypothetical protein WJX84_000665 [Apatococcus fuscideae]|uniref:LIM zinc-binding domain-containing protein n=1 Tax=Apatococcus fuscideae TaxID=2026836 RepID=A0AAW1T2M2_9CHLO
MFGKRPHRSTNSSSGSDVRRQGVHNSLTADEELAKRLQDEEIARAHGYKQQAPASPSHAGQRRQPHHDAQLAAALKQSTLESSNSNYSGGSRARSNGPSYYHTFPNGAESSLPPSQQALYPSSSQPYPQAASGYAPGGPSHMSQGQQHGSSSQHGLQSSPSLMDDWPVSPPAQTPTNQNDEALARSLQLDEDLATALQLQTPTATHPSPSSQPAASESWNLFPTSMPTQTPPQQSAAGSGWNAFGSNGFISPSSPSRRPAAYPPVQRGPFTMSGRFSPPVSLPAGPPGGFRSSSPHTGSTTPAGPTASSASGNKDSCAGCGKGLGLWGLFPSSEHIVALGQKWHPDCFKCPLCALPIAHGTFAIGDDQRAYHVNCHKQAFHPCCSVCKGFLPVEKDNRVVFLENRFWHERYCPKHQKDGTHRCTACSRLQPAGQDWTSLQDGRALCPDCLGSMVLDTAACQPLYQEIISFFAGMGMHLPERPPLMLVESSALNEVAKGRHGSGPMSGSSSSAGATFHTRGLTMTEHHRTIRTVVRGSGPFNVVPQVTHIPGEERCTVTAILVLYGLPRLLTGSILAHEVMHAWLRMHGCTHLGPKEEEGLCQLVALLWLERQDPTALKGKWEERLASYLGHQIRTDPSPTYGDGLRAALESFQQRGLPATVDAVQKLRRFP